MTEAEGWTKIFSPGEAKGQAIMKRKKITLEELIHALAVFQENTHELKTIFGIAEKGFYGSSVEDCEEGDPITFIPWVQIYEILGIVEVGTTEEFIEGGAEYN